MNNGRRFEYKIIFKDVSSDTINTILSLNLPGIIEYDTYERFYYYDTFFNVLLGRVGRIKKEDVNNYLKQNYDLSDLVGISYLEEANEPYLKGSKATFLINPDNSLTKVKNEEKGRETLRERESCRRWYQW